MRSSWAGSMSQHRDLSLNLSHCPRQTFSTRDANQDRETAFPHVLVVPPEFQGKFKRMHLPFPPGCDLRRICLELRCTLAAKVAAELVAARVQVDGNVALPFALGSAMPLCMLHQGFPQIRVLLNTLAS